jgi:hypothetical protein
MKVGEVRRLSQEVGDVLVSYLRDARPATPHREIFLR